VIADDSTNANDDSCAAGDAAQRSKNRTIVGAIKGLFHHAAKAVLRRGQDETPKPRRRRGETEGDFARLARRFSRRADVRRDFKQRAAIARRYLAIPAEAYAVATAYLASTLDMLNQWNHDGGGDADFDEGFDTNQNHISPQP
jgi:hypothetical protein